MEQRVFRKGNRTVWCRFTVKERAGRPERHDMTCRSREANGERRFAELRDMGGTLEEDLAFFRAFAETDPDPAFLLELFEDR